MKRFLFIVLLLIFCASTFADELLGGEITWTCNANGTYTFEVVLYRDCSAAPLSGSSVNLDWNGSATPIVCNAVDTSFISPSCYSNQYRIICDSTVVFSPVERYVYQSSPIGIAGAIPSTGYHFTLSRPDRPDTDNISNGSSNGYLLRAVMYPFTQGGSAQLAGPCYDHSPQFGERPQYAFNTSESTFVVDIADPDPEDSIHVSWGEPWTNGATFPGTTLAYDTGFAYNQPLPGTNFNSSNIPVSLQSNGLINFKSLSTGRFTVCYKVESWREGQKIAEVFRDFEYQINVDPGGQGVCGSSQNSVPTLALSGPTTLTPVTLNGKLAYYEATVMVGDSVSVTVAGSDFDLNANCTGQVIVARGSGPSLADPSGSSMACMNAPCATLTSLNSGGGFASALTNSVRFDWIPDTNHATGTNGEGIHDFQFSFTDDYCVLPGHTNVMIRIKVRRPIAVNPSMFQLCSGDTASATVSGDVSNLSWSPTADISCTTCATPQFYPNTSTTYTVTDLNSGYSEVVEVEVSPAIVPIQFGIAGNDLVIANANDYDTVTWRRNFAPFYPNPSNVYTPWLSGSYWVEARSGACAEISSSIYQSFSGNLSANNDSLGSWIDVRSANMTHGCTFRLDKEPWYSIDGIYLNATANNQQNDLSALSCRILDQQLNVVFQSDSAVRITDDIIKYFGNAQLTANQDYLMAIYTDTSVSVPTYKPSSWPVVAGDQRALVFNATTAPGNATPTINADDYPFFHFDLEWGIGVDEMNRPSFNLYPNPAKDRIHMASSAGIKYQITSATGAAILSGSFDQQGSLDISMLANGVYLVKIHFENGHTVVKRLVKQ